MTAPESLLDDVMAEVISMTARRLVREKVEAYGRACRIEELRAVWDGMIGDVVLDAGYFDDRLAELEQEGG